MTASSAFMLSVSFLFCHAECHYAEIRYTECHYAEFRYTECRGTYSCTSTLYYALSTLQSIKLDYCPKQLFC